MNSHGLRLMTVLAAFLVTLTAAWAQNSTFLDLVEKDLLKVRQSFVSSSTTAAVEAQNQAMIDALPKTIEGGDRMKAVSYDFAKRMLRTIDEHPVVAWYAMQKYDRKEVNIGYCFGRATYVHLALLKNGVDKRAIKKIWAVGPMLAGGINWAFHVATFARAEDGQWITIDNFPGQIMTIQQWMAHMKLLSADGKLTFYITEPRKFSVSLGTYDRVQLGRDLPKHQDWYRGYFNDLLDWFKDDKTSTEFYTSRGIVIPRRQSTQPTTPVPSPTPDPDEPVRPAVEPVATPEVVPTPTPDPDEPVLPRSGE